MLEDLNKQMKVDLKQHSELTLPGNLNCNDLPKAKYIWLLTNFMVNNSVKWYYSRKVH